MVRIKQFRRILDNEGEKVWESGDGYFMNRTKLYIEYILNMCISLDTHYICVCVCIYIFNEYEANSVPF